MEAIFEHCAYRSNSSHITFATRNLHNASHLLIRMVDGLNRKDIGRVIEADRHESA